MHLAVVHHPDEFGSSYALGLQLAAKRLAPDMVVETIEMVLRLDPDDERIPEDISRTVSFLKATQYTYFFSLTYHDFHDKIMEEAFKQGIAGTGHHNWFFSEALGETFLTERIFEEGSPLHLAHVGASRFSAVGGIPGLSPRYDKLEELLKAYRNPDDIEFLRSVLPKYDTHNSTVFDEVLNSPDFLQSAKHPAAFAYDAAIALGLAACGATKPDTYIDGNSHYSEFANTTFHGATGKLAFNPATGSRLPRSMTFELVNHQLESSKDKDGKIGFKTVRTALFEQGEWVFLEDMVFNDGTSNIPSDLPNLEIDDHHLTPALRAGGLTMCALALVLSTVCALWTWRNKDTRIVKVAQPIFLYIVCAGVFIMASSIIPLSVDEGLASGRGNNIACMSFPWQLTIGFSVMMSGLWAKTERVHRIMKNGMAFKRVLVTAGDVYRPMIAILGGKSAIEHAGQDPTVSLSLILVLSKRSRFDSMDSTFPNPSQNSNKRGRFIWEKP